MSKTAYLTLAILLVALFSQAQPKYSYGLNSYYGGVFRYKSDMPMLVLTDLYGFEGFLMKQTNGKRQWERMYRLPRLGLAVSYFNYGVAEELGEVYSLTGFIDKEFKRYRNSEFRVNLGTGLVYSTVIYDSQTNPENKAVGAKVSYVLRGTLYYSYHLNENIDLNINAAFRHYSNGKMNMPNNGMNFPVVGIGLAYHPRGRSFVQEVKKDSMSTILSKNVYVNVFGATAWREEHFDDYKHKAYSLSLSVNKRMNRYYALNAGFDGFYYAPSSIRKFFSPKGVLLEENEIDGRQAAVTAGAEFFLGKASLLYQSGIYLYDPHKIWSRWYQRYAIKYSLTRWAFLQVGLKTHSRTANMVEWGGGFSF